VDPDPSSQINAYLCGSGYGFGLKTLGKITPFDGICLHSSTGTAVAIHINGDKMCKDLER
jgi:hypothetical protein